MLQSKHKVAEWIKRQKKIHLNAAYKRLISDVRTHRLKVNRWKKMFYANGN